MVCGIVASPPAFWSTAWMVCDLPVPPKTKKADVVGHLENGPPRSTGLPFI